MMILHIGIQGDGSTPAKDAAAITLTRNIALTINFCIGPPDSLVREMHAL
jgi:hypothetical protein